MAYSSEWRSRIRSLSLTKFGIRIQSSSRIRVGAQHWQLSAPAWSFDLLGPCVDSERGFENSSGSGSIGLFSTRPSIQTATSEIADILENLVIVHGTTREAD